MNHLTTEQSTIALALVCVAVGHGLGWLLAWAVTRTFEIKTDFKTLTEKNAR